MSLVLAQLRALVAVLDTGTFTDAAIELRVSQATVSRSVAALEAELGVRLLARSTRHLEPTPLGTRVVEHARRVLAEVAALEQAAAEDRQELQIGYAWSALGRHTTAFARTWARDHPRRPVVFTQVNTPTAGLAEEAVEVAVLRRPPTDRRYTAEQVGTEVRFAALATDHPLAHRRVLDVADFAGTTVGVDSRTGTTTDELWSDQARPAAFRETHHVDDWLTLVAAGEVVGITTEATVAQYPRPGVVYRRVRGVPEVPVWLAWRRVSPPPQVEQLVALARSVYAG